MADDDSVDSDDWGAEELVIPSQADKPNNENNENNDNEVGDDYWEVEKTMQVAKPDPETEESEKKPVAVGEPMIIVDITTMNPDIHSKFDRNSVNKPDEASALRKKIEKNYNDYAFSSELLADGIVIPCGSSVWRDALVRLRDDKPGHYFVPIFPPPKPK